jgi:hypothetical protein
MGSADLRYGDDGRVAWGDIWTSFCDLALAGGPPHRGALLEAVAAEEVLAEAEESAWVAGEIGRGTRLATGLSPLQDAAPGWVGVRCHCEGMAAWLVRAVVAENVSARHEGGLLFVPAGPRFRLEKEIKNAVTGVAKTSHYWIDHTPAGVRAAIVAALNDLGTPLIEPALPGEARADQQGYRVAVEDTEAGIRDATGLDTIQSPYLGWVGVRCADEGMAVWLMRGMIASSVLARSEGNVLFLATRCTSGELMQFTASLARVHRLWGLHTAARREV